MANVLVNEQYLKDIADAVRNKLGTTEKMLPSSMASHIDLISSGSSDAEETILFFLNRIEQIGYDDEDNEIIINEDQIKKVTDFAWPKDLSFIGSYAFYGSPAIALTSLPNTVTSIGDYAFYKCKNLALTSLPENLTEIRRQAFYKCKKLALTSLPNSLTYIGNGAFEGCTNLALTSLPEDAEYGNFVFEGCTNLALTSLPSKWTKISNSMFFDCTNLALTSLPEGITEIGYSAFEYCTNLVLTSLPEGLTEIRDSAFSECENLALTSLPDSITSIGYSAFRGCRNISLTSLPKNLERLGGNAFEGCSLYIDLVLDPSKFRFLDDSVFRDIHLKSVTVNGDAYDYQFNPTYALRGCRTDKMTINASNVLGNYDCGIIFYWMEATIGELIIDCDVNEENLEALNFRDTRNLEILTFNRHYTFHGMNIENSDIHTLNFKAGVNMQSEVVRNCNNLTTINIYLDAQNPTYLGASAIGMNLYNLTTINIIGPSDAISKGMIEIDDNAFCFVENVTINVPWSESATPNAPWGAYNTTVNYNYTGQ